MLNYAETASISTNVPLSPVPVTGTEQETGDLPSLTTNLNEYVPLSVDLFHYKVSRTLKEGYLAACKAHADMEEHAEYGAYIFLTGYEYAHLARQYMSADLPSTHKREWHRGFLLGWNACTFGLQENEEPTKMVSRSVKLTSRSVGTDGWPLDM